MARNKKSFILYCDIISTVDKLPDDLAGKLFKHVLEYVNDNNPDDPEDLLLSIAFEPIKQQLKRDLEKYEHIVDRNRNNGKKGGRPRNPNNPVGYSGNPNKPKKADSDNALDLGSGNDNVLDTEDKEQETRKKTKKRFLPPAQSEVIEYSVSNNLNLTGFLDYYESNGWMVGKNKMKDWKASARGWSGRQFGNNNQSKPSQERNDYEFKPSEDFIKNNPSLDESVLDGQFKRIPA